LPVGYCCLSGNCLCLERLISPFGGFARKTCKTRLISSLCLSILLPTFHILGSANFIFMKFDRKRFTEVCRIVSLAVGIGSNSKRFIRRFSCFSATFSNVTRRINICQCNCRTRHISASLMFIERVKQN